ncbi:MAG: beta-phosphoglucomutase [Bacilli bacterium]|jgi:beta-phosphoglucomutase|nr:beta-phosphoglucomutase [Bacilli bacterium]
MDKKYKGVIFDLDGVLVFTDHFHYLAWKKLADEEGIYFDEKINDRLRGVSRMDSLDIILERSQKTYTSQEKAALAERKNEYYKSYLTKMTPEDVKEETRKTLEELKNRGYKLAIGSSSKNTKFILNQVHLTSMFLAISDGTNIVRSKPDPEVFLKAALFIQEKPADCLIMEDAFAGIEAGKRGGFKTIAIGQATKDEEADYKVQEFKEILNFLPPLI